MGRGIFIKHHSCSSNIQCLLALLAIVITVFLIGCTDGSEAEDQLDNSLFLLNLPANRWVK